MGTPARIQVHCQGNAVAALYLHCDGGDALQLLFRAIPLMRQNDEYYSLARLIGFTHTVRPGNISIGVDMPWDIEDDYSQPDGAGFIFYDCSTGQTEIRGGFLMDEYGPSISLPPPPNHSTFDKLKPATITEFMEWRRRAKTATSCRPEARQQELFS